MAERLDVAGRFAEGVAAIEHTQTYVRACGDPTAVRDIYDSEHGLDLHALDADCTRLRAAGAVALDMLRLQRDQLAALASSWTGPGADAADAFLQRHCNTADTVVTEIRAAAQRCEALRDNLWQLVDAKVATAIAIDDRTMAQRPGWLAAAAAGDREVIGQQIKPYVDNDIRRDWVSAMQSAQAAIIGAYDMVTDRFAGAPQAYFEIPGDLGSVGPPVRPVGVRAPTFDVPAAAPAAHAATPAVASSAPSSIPNTPLAQPDWGAGLGGASGLPGGASGIGGGGDPGGLGGLGGLASRIVDGMGGLLDPSADETGQDPLGEFGNDRAEDRAEEHAEAKDDKDRDDEAKDDKAKDDEADGPVEQATETVTKPSVMVPSAAPVPAATPVAVPAGAPPAAPAGSTPCEIAADELPKAGQ